MYSITIAMLLVALSSPAEVTVEQYAQLSESEQSAFATGFIAGAHYMAAQWLYDQKLDGSPQRFLEAWTGYFNFYLSPTPRHAQRWFLDAQPHKPLIRVYAEVMEDRRDNKEL